MEGFNEALNLLYEIYSPAGSQAGISLASDSKGSPGPITLRVATKEPLGSLRVLPALSYQLCAQWNPIVFLPEAPLNA